MSWLLLVIVATILDSSRIFVDNYTSDVYFKGRGAVSQKLFYGITFIVAAVVLAIIFGIDFSAAPLTTFLLLFVSGLLSGFAGIPYYKALEIDDSTNLGIFVQIAPVLYLLFGWFLLGETFNPLHIVASVIIVSAPLLILLATRKRSRKIKLKAIFYSFLYVLIAVIGNVIFVKENRPELSFISEMIFVFLGKGVSDIIIVATKPKWYRRFFSVLSSSHKKVLRPMLCNTAIGLLKDFAYRGGIAIAPSIALASAASDSVEPIFIFFMGIILTLIWPKFGREKLGRKNVLVHLSATVLVVIGIILLQF